MGIYLSDLHWALLHIPLTLALYHSVTCWIENGWDDEIFLGRQITFTYQPQIYRVRMNYFSYKNRNNKITKEWRAPKCPKILRHIKVFNQGNIRDASWIFSNISNLSPELNLGNVNGARVAAFQLNIQGGFQDNKVNVLERLLPWCLKS